MQQKGISLIELVLTVTILSILVYLIFLYTNPMEYKARTRDEKRMADIATLDGAINRFFLTNYKYPDLSDTLRQSNVLPTGSTSLYSSQAGWIKDDLSLHIPHLPVDPINDATYNYSYIHTDTTYELNAVLEKEVSYAQNDGGNNPQIYEVGNDLSLIP